MKENKLIKAVVISYNKGQDPQKATYKIVKTSKLPPLSMELYARSGKQLQKKKKQVHSRIQEAENMMAVELGRTMRVPQERLGLGNWKRK